MIILLRHLQQAVIFSSELIRIISFLIGLFLLHIWVSCHFIGIDILLIGFMFWQAGISFWIFVLFDLVMCEISMYFDLIWPCVRWYIHNASFFESEASERIRFRKARCVNHRSNMGYVRFAFSTVSCRWLRVSCWRAILLVLFSRIRILVFFKVRSGLL